MAGFFRILLGEEQGMKFVHESVIERGEIFQAIWAGFLEFFKKEDLGTRVELLQQLAQFTHCIAAGRDAENVVNQTFHELLSDIFAGKVAVRKLAGRKEFTEGNGLGGKWETLLGLGCHAESTPGLGDRIVVSKKLYWRSCIPSSVQKIHEVLSRKSTVHGESGSTPKGKMDIWMQASPTLGLK